MPGFGVFPSRGLAVGQDNPSRDAVAKTVDLEHHGHQLLGVQYGETYAMVQLRTPVVPSLRIVPKVGAFEPERFTPLEDAQIARNTVGALTPDAVLHEFETGTDFDRAFTVTTSDQEFASALLTAEVRDLIAGDLWFRVREVSFHDGSLWTTEAGRLTNERMLVNSRQLARLAATAPSDLWDDEAFRSLLATADTSETGWLGRREGFRASVNLLREDAGRQPLSLRSLIVRSVVALALLLLGLSPAVNAVAALTGLAPTVAFTVTYSFPSEAGCAECGYLDEVGGTYERNGEVHEVPTMWWMSFDQQPEKGDVVDVSLGPLWWHPVIERNDTAVLLLLLSLLALLPGAVLARRTYLPRPRRQP